MTSATSHRPLHATLRLVVLAAWGFGAFQGTVAQAEPITVMSSNGSVTGNIGSGDPRFDRNGRFAAFVSEAQNLVPGQNTGGNAGIFLYDRLAGTLKLVSHVPGIPLTGGNQGVTRNRAPSISSDGKWIAYSSASTDLVSGQVDANVVDDVFLWNREADTTQLVSHASGLLTTAANLASRLAANDTSISADGRFVVYFSSAVNLVPGQVANSFAQIFHFDRTTSINRMVSHSAGNTAKSGNGQSITGAGGNERNVSADGRFVTFASNATDLISAVTDTNNGSDVFLWDRLAAPNDLILLSRRAGIPLNTGNQSSFNPVISADGTGIAFTSEATNLEGVTSDTNLGSDVFHYDRADDVLTLVSRAARDLTATGDEAADDPSIGADGSCVAFISLATDLVLLQADTNNAFDVFFWRGGVVALMSHVPGLPKQTPAGDSGRAIIASDCSGVAFENNSTNLVTGPADTNGTFDLFYRPRNRAEVFLLSHVPDETATGNGSSFLSSVAVAGALVLFESNAENLVAGDTNGDRDVFFHGSLIMADGFEAGDFSAWSQHIP